MTSDGSTCSTSNGSKRFSATAAGGTSAVFLAEANAPRPTRGLARVRSRPSPARRSNLVSVERIISSIKSYQGNIKLKFHLVGNLVIEKPPPFVIFHGVLSGNELDRIMSKMNLAISTFALFNKEAF